MNQGTRGNGIGWLAAAMVALTAGCASVDEQQTLAKQQVRLETLSDQTSALSTRNLELVDENAELERERLEARERLEKAEREAQAMSAMVQARAHRDMVDRQVNQALAKAGLANQPRPTSLAVEADGVIDLGRAPIPAPAPSTRGSLSTGTFHLRIISLPANENNAAIVRDIARNLEQQNIAGAVARRSGGFWVVDIGNFASIRTAEAVALKHQLRTMRYKGRQEFNTAYFAQY